VVAGFSGERSPRCDDDGNPRITRPTAPRSGTARPRRLHSCVELQAVTAAITPPPGPGWHPDPPFRFHHRWWWWWDGQHWIPTVAMYGHAYSGRKVATAGARAT
jgi:hypothetical protein